MLFNAAASDEAFAPVAHVPCLLSVGLAAAARHDGGGVCPGGRWEAFGRAEVWRRRQSDQEFAPKRWVAPPAAATSFGTSLAGPARSGSGEI